MKTSLHQAARKLKIAAAASICVASVSTAFAFEGRIQARITQGNRTTPLLYLAGASFLRVEVTATNQPNPVDILDLNSGELTLLFSNNRSFVRLKPAAENPSTMPPGFSQMPGAPTMPNLPARQGVGPANLAGMAAPPQVPARPNMPRSVGPQSAPGAPATPGLAAGMPAMPMMPPPMMEKIELRDTGRTTNLLGFTCEQYEIKQREETMEIWATDKLLPFQPWVRNQPHRFGPRMIEEQWGGLLKAKKLFPLMALLKFSNGVERLRFEVTAIQPDKFRDSSLFQPPPDYREMEPLPF